MPRRKKKPTLVEKVQIIGEVQIGALDRVTPNSWNPNEMSDHQRASLKHGLLADGWITSQALLIWHTDEKGKTRNIIIDGEHRWEIGTELGMIEAPMVLMDGLTEAQAKRLTLKMAKGGKYNDDLLSILVKDIATDFGSPKDLGMELGFDDKTIADLLSNKPNKKSKAKMRSAGSHTCKVQLSYDLDQHEDFEDCIRILSERYDTDNASETILCAMQKLTGEND